MPYTCFKKSKNKRRYLGTESCDTSTALPRAIGRREEHFQSISWGHARSIRRECSHLVYFFSIIYPRGHYTGHFRRKWKCNNTFWYSNELVEGPKQREYFTCLTLYPALALVSMNITFNSFAFRSPSSVLTCLLSERSVLLPTNIIITSLPRSVRTSSIHFEVWWNELASEKISKV